MAHDIFHHNSGFALALRNVSHTFTWGGITSLTDADTGALITDCTLTSASGFDYTHAAGSWPVAVSEPPSLLRSREGGPRGALHRGGRETARCSSRVGVGALAPGSAGPRGRLSTMPLPYIPFITIPEFKKEVIGDSGFDETATPHWVMVRELGQNFFFLDNAVLPNRVLLKVENRNPGVITLTESPIPFGIGPSDIRREFRIDGAVPGPATIVVKVPGSTTVLAQLEVSVKSLTLFKIAIHYVTDNLSNKTTRDPAFGIELANELNGIYGAQTDVKFDPTINLDVDVRASLNGIVHEARDGRSRRPDSEAGRLIAAGDLGVPFNIFLMPWFGPNDERPDHPLDLDGRGSNFVFADSGTRGAGMTGEQVKIAVAHLFAVALGCEPTSDDRKGNHLMHTARAQGRRLAAGNFIPKACANILNPD